MVKPRMVFAKQIFRNAKKGSTERKEKYAVVTQQTCA